MILDVAPEMRDIGLSTAVLIARGLDNSKTVPELLAYRKVAGKRLASAWKSRFVSEHPAIQEYHRVHELFGVKDTRPAPEELVQYVRRNRDFTASGAVIDCYNVASARTLLSMGAHDLDRLELPIAFRRTTQLDTFQPLGTVEGQDVREEFGYVDVRGRVICRMDVLQCDWSKVTKSTRNVVFFIQGNRFLPASVLLKGSWLLAETVTRFCGGEIELAEFSVAGAAQFSTFSKPTISFESFQRLKLQAGTVLAAAPLAGMDLCAVTVHTNTPVRALAPFNLQDAVGRKVLLATNLFPLRIGDLRFTAYIPMLHIGNTSGVQVPPYLTNDVPDGAKAY